MSAAAAASPRILALSGLEPTGAVGLWADLQTLHQLGATGLGIATALTAQGRASARSQPVPAAMLKAQLAQLREGPAPQAVKWGMIPDAQTLRVLRRGVPEGGWWIVDPVVRSSSGLALSSLRPQSYLSLAAPWVVLTPNLDEAAWLLGHPGAPRSEEELTWTAAALLARGFGGVVLKGGHREGAPVDVVASREGTRVLRGRRLPRMPHHRGTGCRFASALAVGLCRSGDLEEAARLAGRVVRAYLGGRALRQGA